MNIYNAKGKKVFIKNGAIIPAGSFIQEGTGFRELKEDKKVVVKKSYNNLCQIWETDISLEDI